MKSVWKYSLRESVVYVPFGTSVLAIQTQNDEPMMWVAVETTHPLVRWRITTVMTGEEIPEGCGEYAGTVQVGWLMVHVWIDEGASDCGN